MTDFGRVGLAGFGEVGFELGRALAAAGAGEVVAWKRTPWDAASRARAAEAGVVPCEDVHDMAARADMVWSVVTAAASVEVAETLAPFMRGKLYLDLNSASPMAKRRGAAAVEAEGGSYVDGAIMGALHVFHGRVPILLAGPAAEDLANDMSRWGMDVRSVGPEAGQASAIKMIRSVYMKGIEALVLETMLAADGYGVLDVVMRSLAETHEKYDFDGFASMLVVSNALHGERRAQEMEQVVLTLEEMGIEPMVSEGALRRLRWSASQKPGELISGLERPRPADVLNAFRSRRLA